MYGPFLPTCMNEAARSPIDAPSASQAASVIDSEVTSYVSPKHASTFFDGCEVYGPDPGPTRPTVMRTQPVNGVRKVRSERPVREYNPLARGSDEESDDETCSSDSSFDEEVSDALCLRMSLLEPP